MPKKRPQLDARDVVVECRRRHVAVPMIYAGTYALKEAGALATIVSYTCPQCRSTVYVSTVLPIPVTETLDDESELAL
jgi:hypothetical protein